MVKEVELKDAKAVERLVDATCKEQMDLSVSCGATIVDARSILALFTLIGKRVSLVASDGADVNAFMRVVAKAGL